jgi:hypothetical protein
MLKERPDIGATTTADLAGKLRLEIRQANVIAPAIGIHDDRMRALVIGAIDEQPARAGLPHFPEGDFLVALHGSQYGAQIRYSTRTIAARNAIPSQIGGWL